MAKPSGYIIYRGPSLIDGAPIVAIAITKSGNKKTGDMVQTYIMRDDVEPHLAVKTGQDASVCGDCKHRPINGGACYVLTFQGPLSTFRAFQRGRYPADAAAAQAASKGRMVRLGTYGDPAAVPTSVWDNLLVAALGNTGYSHQWDKPTTDPKLMRLVMASVDNDAEAAQARSKGLRYFKIIPAAQALGPKEFACPASEEAGRRKTCAECGACDGTKRSGQASPVIIVHGSRAKGFAA